MRNASDQKNKLIKRRRIQFGEARPEICPTNILKRTERTIYNNLLPLDFSITIVSCLQVSVYIALDALRNQSVYFNFRNPRVGFIFLPPQFRTAIRDLNEISLNIISTTKPAGGNSSLFYDRSIPDQTPLFIIVM